MRQRAIIAVLVLVSMVTVSQLAFAMSTVEIGLLVDLNGKTSDVGKAVRRVSEMAVDQVNAQGGVAGSLVNLIVFDTQGDPLVGREGARQLVSHRRVIAVVGPTNWATAMMTKPFFEEKQVPAMMLTWEDSVIRGGKFGLYEYIFQLPLKRVTALERICAFVRAKGWRRAGLVVGSNALGREAREWFEQKGASWGIEVAAVASLAPTSKIAEKLDRMVNQNPHVIVSWCPLPDAANVAWILRRLGSDLPIFQYHAVSPQRYVQLAGLAAKQTFTVSNKLLVWQGLENHDPQKRMIQHFAHQYRDVYRYETQYPISPLLGYVWDSIMMLARATRENGTDGARLRDAIEGIRSHIGLSGVYGFTHEDHNGLDPNSTVIIQVDRVDRRGSEWVGSWSLAN